jgi:hypothetical protein
VAEYRAIFGGAGAGSQTVGGVPDENRLTMSPTGEMGIHLSPCLKSKRGFRLKGD